MTMMAISAIKVGKRHRRDLGDIEGLAASIADLGLLHPIVVRPDGQLIAGERRLHAAKLLGWQEVPVTLVDLERVVQGEHAENFFRKAFTPSEMVAIAAAIEPIERAKAKLRQGERTDKHLENFSRSSGGRALDKVATFTGTSRPTLAKARAVVAAAMEEPDRFEKLAASMDKTGNVNRAFKQLKIARAKEQHAKVIKLGRTVDDLVALAETGKRFGVIYCDPPWPWKTRGGDSGKILSAPHNHYSTSSLDEIARLPVAQLAAENCALFLWCTGPHAIGTHTKVMEAWGFKPSTVAFVWVKQNPSGDGLHSGQGYWTLANDFIATKGSPLRLASDVHQVVMAPVGEHSAKPEEVRRRIERLFLGPYLELYGRKPVPGWTVWGNEIPHGEFRQSCDHQRAEDSGIHVAPVPGDDLSIPEFLRRPPQEPAQTKVGGEQ